MPISIALAVKNRTVLKQLREICSAENDFDIVARSVNGRRALQAILRFRPDIIVLDMRLENPDAVTVLRQVRETLDIRTIVLDDSDSDAVHAAIRIGVQCVMLMDKAPALLPKAIRDVHAGAKWFERDYALSILDRLLAPKGTTSLPSDNEVAQRRSVH